MRYGEARQNRVQKGTERMWRQELRAQTAMAVQMSIEEA